ncbi:MAG: ATP-binding protein [Treponema sp.]|nr:ATP-binding protein [Treponema sp.]
MIVLLILLFLFGPPLSAQQLHPQTAAEEVIDLNQFPLFIHSGFSLDYTKSSFSPTGKGWLGVSPSGDGKRSVRIIDYPEYSKHSFLSLRTNKIEEFSYLIPFFITSKQYLSFTSQPNGYLGLHLASIGDNWEVYLNGILIRSEIHRNLQGNITAHRNYRDVLIPFSVDLVRSGLNSLVFRIVGDPANPMVGLNSSDPYRIAPLDFLKTQVNDIVDVILSLIYIFVGFYILLISFLNPYDNQNRTFGLFMLVLGIYFLARVPSVYQLISDSEVLFKLELVSLFSILPAAIRFLNDLTPWTTKEKRISYMIYIIYGALIMLVILFPPALGHDLVIIWSFISLFTMLYIYGYLLLYKLFTSMQGLIPVSSETQNNKKRAEILQIFKVMRDTPIGNVFIGLSILIFTAIIHAFTSIVVKKNLVLSRYSLIIFTIGTVIVIARRYKNLFQMLSDASSQLEAQITTLNKTKLEAEYKELAYRRIFDGTADPMIFIDQQLIIQDYNRAASILFNTDSPQNTDFIALLGQFTPTQTIRRSDITEIINKLLLIDRPFDLDAQLELSKGTVQKWTLRFEKFKSDESFLFCIRFYLANPIYNAENCKKTKGTFVIENTLAAAESISNKIASFLYCFLPDHEISIIWAALREMIINAIKHGNVNIGKVRIKYLITPKKALIQITDQGMGFDHLSILEKIKKGEQEFLKRHQGIYLALAAFDKVVYNSTGNQVTLKKVISYKDAHYAKNRYV